MTLRSNITKLILISSFLVSGCATNSQNRWLTTIAAGVTCFAIGAATAKKDEEPVFYGAAGAAPCLAGAHIVNQTYFSDKKEIEKLRADNERLNSLRKFKVTDEGIGYFENKNGKKEKTYYKITEGVRWSEKAPGVRVKEVMEVHKTPVKSPKENLETKDSTKTKK